MNSSAHTVHTPILSPSCNIFTDNPRRPDTPVLLVDELVPDRSNPTMKVLQWMKRLAVHVTLERPTDQAGGVLGTPQPDSSFLETSEVTMSMDVDHSRSMECKRLLHPWGHPTVVFPRPWMGCSLSLLSGCHKWGPPSPRQTCPSVFLFMTRSSSA